MELLIWLETSGVATWVNESLWGYPIVLTSHAIGMAIVVGMVTVIDLRILGYAKRIPLPKYLKRNDFLVSCLARSRRRCSASSAPTATG